MALNTSIDLVGNSRGTEIITSATDKMIEGIRGGFITANEIIERSSARNKAKEKAEIALANQATAEATDPELIQARRSQQLAQGAQAQNQLANADLERQAKEWQLKATMFDAQSTPGGYGKMSEALTLAGFPVTVDVNVGLTDANKAEIEKRFAALQEFKLKQAQAESLTQGIKSELVPTEETTAAGTTKGQLQRIFQNGVEITTDDLKNRTQVAENFKRTPFSSYYLLKQGQSTTPVAVTPAAVQPLVQPAQPTTPVATAAVQPVAPAATPSVIQPRQVGQFVPGLGMITSVATPSSETTTAGIKRTDALQRELIDLNATQNKIAQARQLAVPGTVGPGQIGLTQKLHQLGAIFSEDQSKVYTDQNQLNNIISGEIANFVQTWKGAISDRELRFFQAARPKVESTPELWNTYLDEWQSKTDKLKKIVAGELAPDEPAVWAANPKSQSVVAPSAIPAPALSTTPSAAPVLRTFVEAEQQPSGKVFKDASGQYRRRL